MITSSAPPARLSGRFDKRSKSEDAQLLIVPIARLDGAVGIDEYDIAGLKSDGLFARVERLGRQRTEHHRGRIERLDQAGACRRNSAGGCPALAQVSVALRGSTRITIAVAKTLSSASVR